MSKAQIELDTKAIRTVLALCPAIFSLNLEAKTGGWVSVADLYLRAGEGLGAAIQAMLDSGEIEQRYFGDTSYLRLADA